MNTSPRERWLLTLLPSVLMVLLWFGWLRPTTKHQAVMKAFDAAQKSAAPQDALPIAKKQEAEWKAKLSAAEQQRAQIQDRWRHLQAEFANSSERSVVIEQVATVLRQQNLHWLDGKLTNDGSEGESGKQFFKLVDKLREPLAIPKSAKNEQPVFNQPAVSSPTPRVEPLARRVLWKVEFAGEYPQVQAALDELQTVVPQVVPVALRMSPAKPNLKIRLWTLVLAL